VQYKYLGAGHDVRQMMGGRAELPIKIDAASVCCSA